MLQRSRVDSRANPARDRGVLRLIPGGPPDPPSRGWLQAAAALQLALAGAFALRVLLGVLRELPDEELPAQLEAGAFGLYAIGLGALSVSLWRGRRWAFHVALAHALGCIALGVADRASAAIMAGAAILACLLAGRDALPPRR